MANVISFVDSSLSPDNTFTSKRHNSVNATSVVKKQFHPQHFRKVTNNNLSHYAQEAYDQVDSTFLYDPFYSSPLPKKKIKNTHFPFQIGKSFQLQITLSVEYDLLARRVLISWKYLYHFITNDVAVIEI